MNETEIAVRLEAHEHEIGSLKYRVKDLETATRAINDLALSVNKLAINMENMLAELTEQGKRVEALEKVPLETSRDVKKSIITALVGGVIGAVLTGILAVMRGV